ncbi:MAG TPA: GH3 auxin-responsive promoter family protein [Pyrinomonadaceae bacterium]|nr:GH3 auxin-responsive promoter family protein [Pyrinomonadaceae bacterium]
MRGWFNDAIRSVIARSILLTGVVLSGWQRTRIRRFAVNQRRLKRKYRLQSDTPVLSYGPRVVESIRHAAARLGSDARFAMTSGSTDNPKQIVYTKHRLRTVRFAFSDMFARACTAYRLSRTSVYVFSSFERDASLTSLLLDEEKLPLYVSTLQAPYRVQQHPAIRKLASDYGAAAVRLWILTLSNPGVLYATNPATISTFLDELQTNWSHCSRLVKDWCNDPDRFDHAVHTIARRLASRGSAHRLQLVATNGLPVRLKDFAPAVRAYLCWTGGYVKPFLDRIATYLPTAQLIPMYSMSTETIETETVFRDGEAYFLPLANSVVYEFVNDEERLLTPDQLTPGETYAMVVSDAYGLRRYHTGDLFTCRRKLNGLPDLVFLRRQALEYSFAGEKVTAEQLTTIFDHLRNKYRSEAFLTLVPSLLPQPHYKLIGVSGDSLDGDLMATECDKLLSAMNCEYKSKRARGILGPIHFVQTGAADFAEHFACSWETQFKFLPLYRRTWESMSSFELMRVS